MTAVRKVVTLIEEMKEQVQKEADEDKAAYDKYMCWCKTNEEAKTEAIADAEQRIDSLTSLIEELAARESRLKTEIDGLAQDIAEDQDALATATATREKESAAFEAEAADLKETLALLKEAVAVLAKVQLLQKEGREAWKELPQAKSALIQLGRKISNEGKPQFQSILKRDLFEFLGSFEDIVPQHGFLPRKSAALVEQKGTLLPWEKTDEQIGMEAKPNDLVGAAANAKSYNSRTGRIFGLLDQMRDETNSDLSEAQRDDFNALVSFQNLRAAKLGEIAAASQQKKRKAADLADTLARAAEAKEDKESTEEALAADETFLANLQKDCKTEDEDYQKRHEVRSQEIVALAETLRILSEDDARDLFSKTVTFLQVGRQRAKVSTSEQVSVQDLATQRAMQRIAEVARKHRNWALVSFAVRMRLDAFTKVKEAMDKMLVELAKQQKEEYAKWETCKANIDTTEDSIKEGELTKEDLDEKHKSLSNTIVSLEQEIESLTKEVQQNMVSLKEAGEQRTLDNKLYQNSITDQKATTEILNRALARLKEFYSAELLQQPGRAVAAPPPKPKDYAKSGNSGAVIQLIMKIIENSEVEEEQLLMAEQRAGQMYAEFAATATAAIEADRDAIQKKIALKAETAAARSETEGEQLSNDETLVKLNDLLKAHHLECDYLLKYFDVRQQARAEEMDAITDAKAVLSGASFQK